MPEIWTWLTVRFALPVLLAVTLCEPIAPTAELTETALGVTESCAAAAGLAGDEGTELLPTPVQPETATAATAATAANTKAGPRFLREEYMYGASLLPNRGLVYLRQGPTTHCRANLAGDDN